MEHPPIRKPLTVLIDPALEQRLLEEQQRLEAEGLRVSKTQVAARAMAAGFEASAKR